LLKNNFKFFLWRYLDEMCRAIQTCKEMNNIAKSTKAQAKRMKSKAIILLSSCYFFVAFMGCNNSKADLISPLCNPDTVSLKNDLTPIMEVHCFNCHSAVNAPVLGGSYNLEDYPTVSGYVTSGYLIATIKHVTMYIIQNDTARISPSLFMPKNGGMLSECEINKFIIWGQQGAHNN